MGMMPSATAPSDAQTSPAGAPTAQDTAPATPAAPVSSQTARPSATTSAAPVTTATTTTAPKPGAATTGTTASGAAPTRPGTAADQPSWWQTSKGPGPKTPGGSAQGTQPAAGSAPSGSIPGQWWEAKKAAEAGAQFETAVVLSEQGKHGEAEAAFAKIAAEGTAGYRTLARFRAAEASAQRDPREAVKAYDALAADGGIGQVLQDLAQVRAGLILVDAAPYEEMRARLEATVGAAVDGMLMSWCLPS